MTCPLCGAALEHDRLLVDLNTNTLTYRGVTREVRPAQVAELVYHLARVWPKTARYADIADAMWGHRVPERMREGIATHICWARKELKPFGITIETVPYRGYRLNIERS